MTIFFVTGIDTGIGKTLSTGLAARYFHQQGKYVLTQKLIQTGQSANVSGNRISEDILEHRQLMNILPTIHDLHPAFHEDSHGESYGALTCPYMFDYPASPHFAALLENQQIDPKKLTQATQTLAQQCDVLFVEGAGGWMVPLSPTLLTADYIAQQHYPIILVTSGRLGSLNHTLLTLESIRKRKLSLACLVFNQYPAQDAAISADTLAFFRRLTPSVVLLPAIQRDQTPNIDFSCLTPYL